METAPMAVGGASSSTSSSPPLAPALVKDKPIIIRVKRKPSQTCPDAFWLEINERPAKKSMIDFSSLLDSWSLKAPQEPRGKMLLVQHVKTTEAVESVLHSLWNPYSAIKEMKNKTKKWIDRIKQDKKQEQLRSTTRQNQEDQVRNTCFAQIRRSQTEGKGKGEESIREICHLYDAIRVDPKEEKYQRAPQISSFEEGAILSKFLPLLREHLPLAAEEIESDLISLAQSEDGHVYDIYTVKKGDDIVDDAANAIYPWLQAQDEDDEYYVGPDHCDYDANDSNAEDNPKFDYPEERPSEEDKDDEFENPFYTIDGFDSEYEKEEIYEESNEEGHQRAPKASRISSFEESAILCDFLPLLQEHLPSAADEIESDIISPIHSEDEYVYDIYAAKEGEDTCMDDAKTATYPLLLVDHEDDEYYFGPDHCNYDADDSSAEDNPLFDYSKEEPSKEDEDDKFENPKEGEDDEFENPFYDVDCSASEYEKEEVYVDLDEDYF